MRNIEHRLNILIGKKTNFQGVHFWARSYAASTAGLEVEAVRKYIREQEDADEYGRF